MIYKNVLIEKNYVPGNLKWTNPVKVLRDYDMRFPIGNANIIQGEQGEIIADIQIDNNFDPKGLFPGIGWEASEDWVYENDILQAQGQLRFIGLSNKPNIDPEITAIQ